MITQKSAHGHEPPIVGVPAAIGRATNRTPPDSPKVQLEILTSRAALITKPVALSRFFATTTTPRKVAQTPSRRAIIAGPNAPPDVLESFLRLRQKTPESTTGRRRDIGTGRVIPDAVTAPFGRHVGVTVLVLPIVEVQTLRAAKRRKSPTNPTGFGPPTIGQKTMKGKRGNTDHGRPITHGLAGPTPSIAQAIAGTQKVRQTGPVLRGR